MEPKKKYLYIALFWTVLVTFLSLVNNIKSDIGLEIPYKDKIVHFVFYSVFTGIWGLFFLTFQKNKNKTLLLVFFFSIFYGIIMEICQGMFTTTREPDVYDVLANTLGSVFGWCILCFLLRKKK